jgi:uncharacterized protein YjiS (DUF1127 family)
MLADFRFWHFASFVVLRHFGRFRRIADIVRDWREMAQSRMTLFCRCAC